jgi:hypothetical protein
MRERWFGATGRKVPEIALEGNDRPRGSARARRRVGRGGHPRGAPRGHSRRRPLRSAEDVYAALSLGPVACALVTDESLLAVDLAEMTYG